jgi:hypothetical protein
MVGLLAATDRRALRTFLHTADRCDAYSTEPQRPMRNSRDMLSKVGTVTGPAVDIQANGMYLILTD